MGRTTPLAGREIELEALSQAAGLAREGTGSVLLLSGEAGVGKTRLAAECAAQAGMPLLRGAPRNSASSPYEPLTAVLRAHLRSHPDGLGLETGSLRPHLALILPELGDRAEESDRTTIFEALRRGLSTVAAELGPVVILLDDLQWSDEATLEAVSSLARPLADEPILLLAAYRSDALARGHGLRRLRDDMRRGGSLWEVTLGPLDSDGTRAMLESMLGEPVSAELCAALHDRAGGSPFFVEELVAAMRSRDLLTRGESGLELAAEGAAQPIPDTVRDAVLIGLAELSQGAREATEAAAVAGDSFDLATVAEIASRAGLLELIERGLVVDCGGGNGSFRHSLAREALYDEVPWLRRRDLHCALAESLESQKGRDLEVATHWLAGGEDDRARGAFSRSAAESEAVGAHRDAVSAVRRALELWPKDREEMARVEALRRYAVCSELAGDPGEASKAWRELATIRHRREEPVPLAEALRRQAAACELRGERDVAFSARRRATETLLAVGRRDEAAVERLAMANHQRIAARFGEAVELAEAALDDAREASRPDLEARALGLLGVSQAKRGDYERGLGSVRAGLSLAIDRDLTAEAAELYQRLSLVLYDAADYGRAEEALDTALTLCQSGSDEETELACVTCLVYVLRERGEWERAASHARQLIETGRAVWVAEGLLGAIHAFQGDFPEARQLLSASRAISSGVGHYNMYMDSTTALAQVAEAEGDDGEARSLCHSLLSRWEQSEDHHYAVWGLRWAATYFARAEDRDGLLACSNALTRMATDGGHPDALAALAQSIGELALLDAEPGTAADQMRRAVELHDGLGIPHERAQIELRAGVAAAAAGDRERGIELLCDSYRTARRLGAQPVAKAAAAEVAALGDSVAARLGRRSAEEIASSPLTRRELEVLGHVSAGRTNREIAQELFLSHRTVDMHVRNILRKLECRSRTEAVTRAGELELLA